MVNELFVNVPDITHQASLAASTTPADGDVASYDAASGKWVAAAGGGGSGLLKHTRVSLSSADILALNDTPIEIVPAVAGIAHMPVSVSVLYRAGGTPYVLSDPDVYLIITTAALRLVSVADGWFERKSTGILDAASDQFATISAELSDLPPQLGDPATVMGQAMIIGNDRDSDYTDGDGTLDVDVWYVEVED